MLTALAGKERLVAPRVPAARLRALSREEGLRCPACDGAVVFKAGAIKVPHFAHRPGADCPFERDPDTAPESETHLGLKLALWERLSALPGVKAELEAPLPHAGRRADLLVTVGRRKLAVEVQCSALSGEAWRERHEAYAAAGIADTWILAGPPPDAFVIPAAPRRGLPASYRLKLRDLGATILGAEGQLVFGWLGKRAGDDLYAQAAAGLPRAPATLLAVSALAAHHGVLAPPAEPAPPWDRALPRAALTISGRYLVAAPVADLLLERDPLGLRAGEAHAALAREAAARDGATAAPAGAGARSRSPRPTRSSSPRRRASARAGSR